MRNFTPALLKLVCATMFLGFAIHSSAQQQLNLTDFAVWGGSASANTYNSSQGVFIGNTVVIQGNVGSNHRVAVNNLFNITGHIYSGNIATFGNIGKVTGNIFAAKTANNYTGNVITGDYKLTFAGNLSAKGKINLKKLTGSNASSVTGQVAVPAPSSTNYIGPTPVGGFTNTLSFPLLPAMPNSIKFDNQVGTKNVTSTSTITPGKYKKLGLAGSKTITFSGPGNYIFNDVDNGTSANKLIFDFKGTTTGTINIFVIKDAKWGRISVSTKNGNFPSRIYTEVHGTGSTNSGIAFGIIGPLSVPSGSNVWLGNVWAPNGGISVKSLSIFNAPHIVGALWSAKKVELDQNLKLVYNAPAVGTGPAFIEPVIAAPANGKVAATVKVGAELTVLQSNPSPIISQPDNELFIIDNSTPATPRVLIEVISKDPNDATLRQQLITLGMRNADGVAGTIDNGPHIYTITGYFPINLLSQLNNNTRIEYVRPLYPPISNSGFVMSQGDATMRSDVVRSRFGVDGSGVKIGVISDSYGNKADPQVDVNEGELPGPRTNETTPENPERVQVVQDLLRGGNDEGRAMLQIVHDVAPKAKLAFHTGFLSAGQFAKAIQTLASPNLEGGKCDVIVDDLTYITEPFQRDGVVAQSVNQAVASGVTYISSAGNFGNKSYEGVFTPVTNTSVVPVGQIHRFGGAATDIYQTVNLKPGNYTIGLQWSDEFSSLGSLTGVTTDLDLYILDANGFVLFGFNRSNLFGDPFEICAFTVKQETNAKLMIVRASGLTNVRFKYIFFRGEGSIIDFQSPTPSSIVGHPNADSAIAVGAMLYANIPGVTPVWPGVASFSSRGGTFTRVNNGTTFSQRSKPEIIGPNGVNTTVDLGGAQFNDGDTHPNFFGTSAAAPHVAGVAALIFQARKKYGLQSTIKPYDIRQQLVSSAGKFASSGNFSFDGGYGFVQADSAILQTANARPIISRLENGNGPLEVRVEGKYLVSNTQISVNNILLPTSVSINAATGVGTATATIPANLAGLNPGYRLYNPPKSPSEDDGGYSETLRFSGSKIKILVKADNKTRKYGQENQNLTSSVDVVIGEDTTDISQTSLLLSDLKLENLALFTNATAFSLPRSYGISIARTTPLPEDDPLLEQYDFEFRAGTMTVEKMPLTIQAFGQTLKYGDDISNISYAYTLNEQAQVSPLLLEEVKTIHRKYIADNGLIVFSDFNEQHPSVSVLDFYNMSTLASFQSVLNARKFISQNGQLKPLASADISQIGDQRFIVDVSAKSLVKYKQDSVETILETPLAGVHKRGFLNVKALTAGDAGASVSGEPHTSVVNGQLMAMVNGQLKALVNGQLKALVNGVFADVRDLTFQNSQLRALDNNFVWTPVTQASIIVTLEGQSITVDMTLSNGQLTAVANGQPMTLQGGELQATINGQEISLVNGQLKALVNGQVTPLVNGELTAFVNGQLKALVNGQLKALVNGQLLAEIDGEYETVQDIIILDDGEIEVVVNGQLKALVNGQLKALVNGVIQNVPTTSVSLLNGQLRAVVNGETVAYINGQLHAVVNGQLKALVNGSGLLADGVVQVNGQLKALVNGLRLPVANGQLEAMVNGQLFSMVDGQLMAANNDGTVNFVVFQNGQLKALVNGELENFEPVVNGQLKAIVNGKFEDVEGTPEVLPNGQLKALVNGETWVFPNGQLKALVNGQLRPLVNNFDVSGAKNNTKTLVLLDEDDVNDQSGDVGGMFAMNMITGLNAGLQTLIPAAFVNENFEVTYLPSGFLITDKPLYVSVDNATKNVGQTNPPFNVTYDGFAYSDNSSTVCHEVKIPETTVDIDQLERRTTYTNVKINGGTNSYIAAPGESLTLTGNWSVEHFAEMGVGFVASCPTCITQNYIGMANGDYTGNQFDICIPVGSSTAPISGSISQPFTAPTRPGVYYITQQSSWYFSCYQFGHIQHNQNFDEAIAVVIVPPADGLTAQTTATTSSPVGPYDITINGCYFPNYRVIFTDGTLTVEPVVVENPSMLDPTETVRRQTKLYPNPASDIVRLQLEHDVQSVSDIKIYDGMGRLQAVMSRKQAEGYYEINVAGLKPGIYLVNARTAVGVKTFKFMKM